MVTFILVPFLPLMLAALFRALRGSPAPGSLWWCSEVPFFSITLSAAAFLKCRDLATVKVTQRTVAQSLMPWLELLLGSNGFMSLVFLSAYYSDTYLTAYSPDVRTQATILSVVFAISAFVLALMGMLLELLVQRAKEKR
ncbi:hypothetical protein WME75_01375 [Sorangium sp. So ce1014]|uniref:hypothetical protein n=1 Tax=Sorangium sp. So ce1014 TaxID=3133326 RepID=UPI003F6470D3